MHEKRKTIVSSHRRQRIFHKKKIQVEEKNFFFYGKSYFSFMNFTNFYIIIQYILYFQILDP